MLIFVRHCEMGNRLKIYATDCWRWAATGKELEGGARNCGLNFKDCPISDAFVLSQANYSYHLLNIKLEAH